MNPKFASVEGGERGILSRRWSMCGDAFTILPKIKLFPLWFTDAYPVCFCFAAELCAEALSQDGLRQVLLRRLLYCLICEYIALEVGRVAWLIAWLYFIFFRPKKTEAPSAGTFTFGSETRPRRFDTFYFLLLTRI